jgi:RNA polymerase sigma factor (sigma-70 family)
MGESSSRALPKSDAELIAAVASGEASPYVILQERHTPAALFLARQVAANPAEAREVLSATFARVRDAIRRGDGPAESLRPYLLTAVRRVALERSSGAQPEPSKPSEAPKPSEPAAGGAQIPNLGEPLFTDPAVAELESTTLARAYASLPERLRAAAWFTMIERTEPAETAKILGLTEAGVEELPAQVRAALSQAYLELYLSGLTQEACKAEAGQLGQHLNSITRGLDERTVRVHLRGCRECRAVAVELSRMERSLRRTIAPIVLGSAADAYVSALGVNAAPAGQATTDGLRWIWEAPRWIREAPSRMRRASRQQQAMAGGVLVLAAFAIAGLSLTLVSSVSPQHRAERPLAAAIPPTPAATVPSSSSAPAPTRPARARSATTPPVKSTSTAHPAMAHSASPAPTTPAPTSPAPTTPAPTPTPTPVVSPPPHHHHRHFPP